MNPKLDRKLVKKYPTLYRDRHGDMRSTCMCWGFDCGDGWYKIIDDLSKKLEPLCVEANKKLTKKQLKDGYGCRASQVKEKYGTLRFYLNNETDEMADLISEAEKLSAKTCEICGKPGKTRPMPWVLTLCYWHFIKQLNQYTLKGKIRYWWRDLCSNWRKD